MGIWYDKKAYELLKKCSDAKDLTEWNEYRKATNYIPINLRFANLNNFYLQKAELQNVDFRGSSLQNSDFKFSDVENANISNIILIWISLVFFLLNCIGTYYVIDFLSIQNIKSIILEHNTLLFSIGTAILGFSIPSINVALIRMNGVAALIVYFASFAGLLISFTSFVFGVDWGTLLIVFGIGLISFGPISESLKKNQMQINFAQNPEKVIGFDLKYLNNKTKSVIHELQKEASELNKSIELTHDDEEKEKLVYRLEKLEEKIKFYAIQEGNANLQKTQIENVIGELQAPYKYIHQTIMKVAWHNRIYYAAIFGLLAFFIYSILYGYIDQRVLSFTSLFAKDIQPTFGTIFGVILFYGTPVLLGISLIIYFIAQINKNIDKITELQEQERNIKQIASTIKAKAQIGMSDDEFVKETKNLIQKYQEGMMEEMFTKDKTPDKENNTSSSSYREKLMANGISKLIIQAIKSK